MAPHPRPSASPSNADARTGEDGAPGGRRRWVGLVVISLAVSLIIVDSTIVNVAIPSIVKDLGVDSTGVQWVQESYTLVFAALLLVFGTLGDRIGRRRLLLLGVVVFALSSVAAALAPSGAVLIGSRLVQGVGGAMVLPSTLSLINAGFRGSERAIAFAVWGSTIGGMSAVGPLLGGWLTTSFSWRWAFGINIPVAAVIVVGAFAAVAESKDGARRSLDPVGATLSVVASASLVFALIEGRTYGWWAVDHRPRIGSWDWPGQVSPIPFVFGLALAGMAACALWAVRRERRGMASMFSVELLRIPSFRNGNLAALIVSLGEFGIILALPIWLQNVLGFSALDTGLILLALAIGSFAASGLAGALSHRASPVMIVRVGLVAEIVGVAGLGAVIGPDTPWGLLVPFLFVYGFGVGLATAQLTGVVLKDVPVALSGQASGTQSTARQIGSALGIAVLGTVLFSSAGGLLGGSLESRGVPAEQRGSIVSAVVDSSGAAIAGLAGSPATAPVAEDAKTAFSEGTRYAAFSAASFLAVGLLATLSLGSGRGGAAPPASRRQRTGRPNGPEGAPSGRRYPVPMSTELIEIPAPDGPAEAVVARPPAGEGPFPGVILYMDAFGIRPRIEEMAQRIADWGYVVLAPNVFYREGSVAELAPSLDMTTAEGREEAGKAAFPRVGRLTAEKALPDIDAWTAALRGLEGVAPGPIGVTGYCMGARLAVRTANAHPEVAACGGFHGGGLATDDADSPHLGLPGARARFVFGHADHDRSMGPEAVARLGDALAAAGLEASNVIYPGASHGYSMADTSAYDEEATERHFRELRDLFDATLAA